MFSKTFGLQILAISLLDKAYHAEGISVINYFCYRNYFAIKTITCSSYEDTKKTFKFLETILKYKIIACTSNKIPKHKQYSFKFERNQ